MAEHLPASAVAPQMPGPQALLAWGMRIKDPGSHCLFPFGGKQSGPAQTEVRYKQKNEPTAHPQTLCSLPQQGLKPVIPGHSTHTMREVCCWWGLHPCANARGKPPAFQNLPEKKVPVQKHGTHLNCFNSVPVNYK